jgi:hypothetical protein
MKRMLVQSSIVQESGYDAAERKLEVQFHSGKVYQYLAVPHGTYEAFIASESKGRFFNEQIRDVYRYVQVLP